MNSCCAFEPAHSITRGHRRITCELKEGSDCCQPDTTQGIARCQPALTDESGAFQWNI